MNHALELALRAKSEDEVPVGAVIVHENRIIGQGYNQREGKRMATNHAELLAIEKACGALNRWRLSGCTLYVTLEPCLMCAGAIVNSRIDRVVYGAIDPKAGAVESLFEVLSDKRLNHRPEVTSGVLKDTCRELLSAFFQGKRRKQ